MSAAATQCTAPSIISTQSDRTTPKAIVGEIDTIIEQYKKGEIAKSQAIKFVTTKLAFDLTRDKPSKDSALHQYITTIDSIERIAIESIEHGARVNPSLGGNNGSTRAIVINADETPTFNESSSP